MLCASATPAHPTRARRCPLRELISSQRRRRSDAAATSPLALLGAAHRPRLAARLPQRVGVLRVELFGRALQPRLGPRALVGLDRLEFVGGARALRASSRAALPPRPAQLAPRASGLRARGA